MSLKKRKRKINQNLNQIKKYRFVHGIYKIHWEKPNGCRGYCTDPKDRQIWLNPRERDKDLIVTACDEAIHACLWAIDNDYVGEMSSAIGGFLYELGFRLEREKEKKKKKK